MAQWLSDFFSGSISYHVAVGVLTLIGILLAVTAVWVAVVQLGRTLRAAEAASAAASTTSDQFNKISALVEGNLEGAGLRAFDLRAALAQIRGTPRGATLTSARKWQDIVTEVSMVHELLCSRSSSAAGSEVPIDRLINAISKVSDFLNTLSSRAVSVTGES